MNDTTNHQKQLSVRFYYSLNFSKANSKVSTSNSLCHTELAELNEQAEQFFVAKGFEIDNIPELKQKTQGSPMVDLDAEPLVLSKIVFFTEDDLEFFSETHGTFTPKKAALQQVHSMLQNAMYEFEKAKFIQGNLVFLGAISRSFVFNILYEGSFELYKVFTDEELQGYSSVSEALEDFFDNVTDELASHFIEVTKKPSTSRRAKGGIYRFEFYYGENGALKEYEVEAQDNIYITSYASFISKPLMTTALAEFPTKPNLDIHFLLEELFAGDAELVNFNVNYVDSDDDAFDIENNIVINGKRLTMLIRQSKDIKIVKTSNTLATIEIDIDSIPQELFGYTKLFEKFLSKYAAEHTDIIATIYVYHTPSINFGRHSQSVFFGIAGDKKLLSVIENVFSSIAGLSVRLSDYIDPSKATKDFHIQDGYLWQPYETGSWIASEPEFSREDMQLLEENENAEEDLDELLEFDESEDFDETDAEISESQGRISQPVRFRAARKDAKIGTIKKKIEEVFNLPEGSVSLCGPDKRSLRSDATIATLKRRWE